MNEATTARTIIPITIGAIFVEAFLLPLEMFFTLLSGIDLSEEKKKKGKK